MNSDLIFLNQRHRRTAPFGEVRAGGRIHVGTDYGSYGANTIQHCPLDNGVVHKIITVEQNGNTRGLLADIQWKEHDIGLILQHAEKVLVSNSQKLAKGDEVVTTGMTGKDTNGKHVSSGIHAHVELYQISTGKRLDFESFDFEKLIKGDAMKVYESIDELTGDWKLAVEWALNEKIILGNGKTMGLEESAVKAIVFIYRNEMRNGGIYNSEE